MKERVQEWDPQMAQKMAVVLGFQSEGLWVLLSAKANSVEKLNTFKNNYKYMVSKKMQWMQTMIGRSRVDGCKYSCKTWMQVFM